MKLRFASYFTVLFFLAQASSLLAETFSDPASIQSVDAAVPEPSTYAMVAVGAALLVGLQRFLRKKN